VERADVVILGIVTATIVLELAAVHGSLIVTESEESVRV